jgi:hypothetical protein
MFERRRIRRQRGQTSMAQMTRRKSFSGRTKKSAPTHHPRRLRKAGTYFGEQDGKRVSGKATISRDKFGNSLTLSDNGGGKGPLGGVLHFVQTANGHSYLSRRDARSGSSQDRVVLHCERRLRYSRPRSVQQRIQLFARPRLRVRTRRPGDREVRQRPHRNGRSVRRHTGLQREVRSADCGVPGVRRRSRNSRVVRQGVAGGARVHDPDRRLL